MSFSQNLSFSSCCIFQLTAFPPKKWQEGSNFRHSQPAVLFSPKRQQSSKRQQLQTFSTCCLRCAKKAAGSQRQQLQTFTTCCLFGPKRQQLKQATSSDLHNLLFFLGQKGGKLKRQQLQTFTICFLFPPKKAASENDSFFRPSQLAASFSPKRQRVKKTATSDLHNLLSVSPKKGSALKMQEL
jgi:hypothetical protein